MATIVTRLGKGSALTFLEGDNNFINLNTEKIERDGSINFTGAQSFVAGTAAAPGIRFVGNTNSGLFSPGAGQVGITAGGTQRINISTTISITGDTSVTGNLSVSGTLSGNGSSLTNLNASNLSSGTVPSARISGAYTGITQVGSILEQPALGVSGTATQYRGFASYTNGIIRWYWYLDNGGEGGSNTGSNLFLARYNDAGNFLSNIFELNRANGQVTINAPDSGAHTINGNISFGGTLTGNGSGLTSLNASNLTSGTIPDGRFPATLPAVSGANLTNLNASNLSSGAVPTARLGSGTANTAVFLRGDQQWSSTLIGNITLGSVANPRYRAVHTDGTQFFAGADAGSVFVGGESSSAFLSLYSEGAVRLQFSTSGRADFQKAARTVPTSVAFSSTPTFNALESNVFYFGTLTGNVTSMTISNPADGQTLQIRFVQDGTGDRTVALPSGALVSGSINTAPNSVTWLVITYVSTASRWEGTWTKVS